MNLFLDTHQELIKVLLHHEVDFIIIGGYAVIFHGQPRFTKGIDFLIKADLANAQATYAALAEFGAPLQGIRPEDFAERGSFFRFGRYPYGVDFDAACDRRIESTIDPETGLKAFFISRDDLIMAKLAAARPQDLADVDAIRKAAESQRPEAKTMPSEPDGPSE